MNVLNNGPRTCCYLHFKFKEGLEREKFIYENKPSRLICSGYCEYHKKKYRRKYLTNLQRWQVEIVEEISSIAQGGLKPKQARILRKGYGIMSFIFLQGLLVFIIPVVKKRHCFQEMNAVCLCQTEIKIKIGRGMHRNRMAKKMTA